MDRNQSKADILIYAGPWAVVRFFVAKIQINDAVDRTPRRLGRFFVR